MSMVDFDQPLSLPHSLCLCSGCYPDCKARPWAELFKLLNAITPLKSGLFHPFFQIGKIANIMDLSIN
jgi:hypothetical protein